MVINESGLCAAMKDAFRKRSTGYKAALRRLPGENPEIILSTQDWTVILDRENAPRKVLALLVEHLGDLPQSRKAFHVKDGDVQTEIYQMAVPDEAAAQLDVAVKRTQITYMGHVLYQREDTGEVYMIPQKLENLLDGKLLPLNVAGDGRLFQGGLASRVYIKPYVPTQGDSQALQYFAEYRWI